MRLLQRSAAEFVGTAFLLTAVVGSGIMGERLAGGNVAIALLANSVATGGALLCLILAFGNISGAHFNPVVSLSDALRGGLTMRECIVYIVAQLAGASLGVALANLMFEYPAFFASTHIRTGPAIWIAEFVATFGLLIVIWGCAHARSIFTPFAVAGYIVGAYWFTASTSFANPAVTIARAFSDTFSGIRPLDVPAFIAVQLVAALAATGVSHLIAPAARDAQAVVVPHPE